MSFLSSPLAGAASLISGGNSGALGAASIGSNAAGPIGDAAGAVGGVLGGAGSGLLNVLGGQTHFNAEPVPNLGTAVTPEQAQQSLASQQALSQALAGQGGIQNQSQVYGQQQALASQLGQLANGQGPNPAQAMLAQQTGNNVANQAALMAGQRGAGANAGLIARQAGQQGAATQQQAVGQGATMQAQQQLGALGALQNQQALLGTTAQNQVNNQANATNAYANNAVGQLNTQNEQAMKNAFTPQQINAGVATGNAANAQKPLVGLIGGAGAAASVLAKGATGGEVHTGQIGSNPMAPIMKENYKPAYEPRLVSHLLGYAQGGMVMESGGKVPGKPAVGGAKNSYANDTVPALLSAGEIVLPRSVTQSANPAEAAARFVSAIQNKKGKK